MLLKRTPRPVVFVCAGLDPNRPNEIVSMQIQAASQQEAASLFLEKTKISALNIHGPYRTKKIKIIENTRILKFTNEQKRAIYGEWEVNAMILKEPENHAYLFFLHRVDGKKQQQPKGNIVVPIFDLRIINE